MVTLQVEGDTLHLEVKGWDKFWAMKSRLEIPLAHITDVHAEVDPPMGWFEGLKWGGTDIPNVFRAGTFRQEGGWIFWDVHDKAKAIAISLTHERFTKLIVEVEDPDNAVRLLRDALSRSQTNRSAAQVELDHSL